MEIEAPTLRELRDLVEGASRGRPHLTSRLEKAAFLVLLRSVVPCGPDHYEIGSEDGLRFYQVINGHCECSDYVRHGPGHPCKHRLAVEIHVRLTAGPTHYRDGRNGLTPAYLTDDGSAG